MKAVVLNIEQLDQAGRIAMSLITRELRMKSFPTQAPKGFGLPTVWYWQSHSSAIAQLEAFC